MLGHRPGSRSACQIVQESGDQFAVLVSVQLGDTQSNIGNEYVGLKPYRRLEPGRRSRNITDSECEMKAVCARECEHDLGRKSELECGPIQ